jgi:saccharopine dehydrogenase-like NADP-dependent oxidoreductase
MTIHWCGTGLSAVPGLRRLIGAGHGVVVWNRTVEKAREAVGDIAADIRAYDLGALEAALAKGDLVVSMLPADQHPAIARICVAHGVHFVSSSYIAPEMRALDEPARRAGVALVNEVGLDPGIDHLMAHDLVAGYRASRAYDAANVLSFTSYCGGIPKVPNAFRYKFSWSPLGVLKALRSPSRSIRDFSELRVARPWDAITAYAAPLPVPETFEVYPNRDSVPFIGDYRFDTAWKVRDFVRGTIRLNGWADAWAPVFAEIETLSGPEGDARLKAMSDQFWRENSYGGEDDPDRVVLFVSLRAEKAGRPVWHQTWALDAWGDVRGTAMSRLVSVPVALAVESVLNREIAAGVHAAPHDPRLVSRWLDEVGHLAQYMRRVDHLG